MKALLAVEGKKNVGEPRWFDGDAEVKELERMQTGTLL